MYENESCVDSNNLMQELEVADMKVLKIIFAVSRISGQITLEMREYVRICGVGRGGC